MMIKMDLVEIGNIPGRNKKALTYSHSVKARNKFISSLISAIIGILLGLIVGYFQIMNVHAAENMLSEQDWINICYIARVVEAEAGNQCDYGKKLVADTILNRLDSDDFPDTIVDVLQQKNQYADGIIASDETIRIVMDEYVNRTNYDVLYFRTERYHSFAENFHKVGDHYFSM